MKTHDFFYDLPPKCIAQTPAPERSQARMMVVDRKANDRGHLLIADLPGQLQPNDLLILNDTRVIPARMRGHKSSGGKAELFFLEATGFGEWDILLKTSKRPATGSMVHFADDRARAEVLEELGNGRCRVKIHSDQDLHQLMEQYGETPLPPYIRRAAERPEDRERYQTVYAREPGAVAAPTAGLHFTPALLEELARCGVETATITLHVGLGTFRPVSTELLADHEMESERYVVPASTAEAINRTRASGGRIIAVGSTSVRTLETIATDGFPIKAGSGRSRMFIHPPYDFKLIDGMLTNFHLPESTLIMMVCALGGYERIMQSYREAIRENYRFYSYGDCMLVI
ncbi:MAG: tRNA preQ1(34) S-adenosylmethionine ribosyltransferase-isomerase QueA [Verrucomicrobiota bacterium]